MIIKNAIKRQKNIENFTTETFEAVKNKHKKSKSTCEHCGGKVNKKTFM